MTLILDIINLKIIYLNIINIMRINIVLNTLLNTLLNIINIFNTINIYKHVSILIYMLILNILSYILFKNFYIEDKDTFKRINKKTLIEINKNISNENTKKIVGILVITCNTILYCVLYKQMQIFNIICKIYYIFTLVYIAIKDIKTKIITNKSNIILFLIGLINLISVIDVSFIKLLTYRMITCIIAGIILMIVRKIFNNQLGGGDVKMLSALCIYFPISKMIEIILISLITSFIYALYLVIIKRKGKNYKFAFGEFISFASIIVLLN